jgi:hypothetical protein
MYVREYSDLDTNISIDHKHQIVNQIEIFYEFTVIHAV